jgi:hypothetical protein
MTCPSDSNKPLNWCGVNCSARMSRRSPRSVKKRSKTSFAALNRSLDQSEEKVFANPRNAASGTLRQLDAKVVRDRALSFFAFEIQHSSKIFASDYESLAWLLSTGVPVIPDITKCRSAGEVIEAIIARRETGLMPPIAIRSTGQKCVGTTSARVATLVPIVPFAIMPRTFGM